MKKCFLYLWVLSVMVARVWSQDAQGPKTSQILPKGDATKGRIVFQAKQCHRCHTVTGAKFAEIDLPAIANIALAGDNNSGWDRDDYAHHILDPGHIISPEHQRAMIIIGDKLGAESSPMPSFLDLLTLRDLIDLSTFLEESGARR